jgi:hypothetical protein
MAHILSMVLLPFTSPLFPAQRGYERDFSDVLLSSRVSDVQFPDKQAAAMLHNEYAHHTEPECLWRRPLLEVLKNA